MLHLLGLFFGQCYLGGDETVAVYKVFWKTRTVVAVGMV